MSFNKRPTFAEFFAGGGMVNAALESQWDCVFANDISEKKAKVYEDNWGSSHFQLGDVGDLTLHRELKDCDMYWASSPCQDLSYAGRLEGLSGSRSSAFWGFWKLIVEAKFQNVSPKIVVVENVRGLVTSNDGQDIQTLHRTFSDAGYRIGILEINASSFLPQSRPRIFVVAIRSDVVVPEFLIGSDLHSEYSSPAIKRFHNNLDNLDNLDNWINFDLAVPRVNVRTLESVLETADSVKWHTPDQSSRIFDLMKQSHRVKLGSEPISTS
jgi:DNA (cytosine-5)-methyltransferase 1